MLNITVQNSRKKKPEWQGIGTTTSLKGKLGRAGWGDPRPGPSLLQKPLNHC